MIDLFGKIGRHWLGREVLPPDERARVEALLRQLDFRGGEPALADRELAVEAFIGEWHLTAHKRRRLELAPGAPSRRGIFRTPSAAYNDQQRRAAEPAVVEQAEHAYKVFVAHWRSAPGRPPLGRSRSGHR
uniref:Uncharacterized protein n=1 Tax=uncultured bacterium esnapd15 TaxID=1366595 RepID=S5UCY8_9BACT|nr:hypothetical protein [uncultured bacterium esnapd15]